MPEKPWLPPSMREPKPRFDGTPVTVSYAAKKWNACWEIQDGKVHVFGAYGEETRALRGRAPEEVASVVLLGLVKKWLAR